MNQTEVQKQIDTTNNSSTDALIHPKNRIGCGWCVFENKCVLRNPKINQAKAGCEIFHYDIRAGKI